MTGRRTNLLGMTRDELSAFVRETGESAYRGGQLYQWLYARGASSFGGMTDLARNFRARLDEVAAIGAPEAVGEKRSSADGTVKLLFALEDGLRVESVLIPPASAFRGEAGEQNRLTLCVSTQVGCALDCAFCATGTMGFTRNLTPGEIVGQVLAAARVAERKITNVVFMGMGEPLLNYEATMKAAAILTDGCGIAARHITVSTAGRADRIRRMADDGARIKLAVSLHSAVDATRSLLMPINRKYPLPVLMEAVEYYYRKTRRRVTYEVIFFDGVNDAGEDVRRLVTLARRVPSKINIIPFHAIGFARPEGLGARLRPSPRMEAIAGELRAAHLTVMVRMSAGEDIDAACGQLALGGVPVGSRRGNVHHTQTED
ncbi:MAG TPA: 23S rRNA (adenine(2503)-C(2))-methyltransferase RlmN [Bacteroidota bacterium]|nr:23S rRNA (adenine(2503)-C(2))-methyltransferase RlmN [Bacteroidota bacterium]